MSWSVHAVGKPAAVKIALVQQFAAAKQSTAGIRHENVSVDYVEQIVNDQLDFLVDIPNMAVTVAASGSAYKSGSGVGSSQISVKVDPIYGWVE